MKLLTTHNLTIRIGNQTICDNINLQIKSGETWGILGPNGSGKTTLLQTLGNLRAPTQGELWLQHRRITSLSTKEIARYVGILFQDSMHTFPQTVFESCLAGRHPHLSRLGWKNTLDYQITDEALAAMELTHLAHHPVDILSGGERQRLAIATILTQTPLLYLLDEPTNHLDIRHQIKVLQQMKLLCDTHSAGVVMSLHDVNLAQQFCQHILMLFKDGETLIGTPDEILTIDNLTRLYQHPMQYLSANSQKCWMPNFNCNSAN
jgi:iron complex transport system ATP-binding protein